MGKYSPHIYIYKFLPFSHLREKQHTCGHVSKFWLFFQFSLPFLYTLPIPTCPHPTLKALPLPSCFKLTPTLTASPPLLKTRVRHPQVVGITSLASIWQQNTVLIMPTINCTLTIGSQHFHSSCT